MGPRSIIADGMRAPVLLVLLLFPGQEAGLVTIDRQGSIGHVLQDLRAQTGVSIHTDDAVDPKAIAVNLSKLGFYEALDAICRVHGNVMYSSAPSGPDVDRLELKPAPWIEFPSVYTSAFKVLISEMAGFTAVQAERKQDWARVYLVAFGPPWIRIHEEAGARADWTIDEVKDADGKDLLLPKNLQERDQRLDILWHGRYYEGNVTREIVQLRAFDLDRGLQILRGRLRLTVADTKEIEIPVEAGKSVETSAGTITVESVKEHDKTERGVTWRVAMSLKPKGDAVPLRQVLENRFRSEPDPDRGPWQDLELPKTGAAFESVVRNAAKRPTSVKLYVREGERRLLVPFTFKDVRLGAK